MTPEQIAAALGDRNESNRRGRTRVFTPEENKRRQSARSSAQSRAKTALSHLHKDDYDALYRAAFEQEMGA